MIINVSGWNSCSFEDNNNPYKGFPPAYVKRKMKVIYVRTDVSAGDLQIVSDKLLVHKEGAFLNFVGFCVSQFGSPSISLT